MSYKKKLAWVAPVRQIVQCKKVAVVLFHKSLFITMSDYEAKTKTRITPREFGEKVGPLLSGMFILYLIVAGNYVGELFNCGLQDMLQNNYAVKHMLGFMTMYFFVTMLSPNINWHQGIVAGMTMVMYLIFVISNRTNPKVQIAALVMLFAVYILQVIRDQREQHIVNETDADVHADMVETNERIVKAQWGLAGAVVGLIIIGFVVYTGKKRLEFGREFSYVNLFKGTMCRKQDARPYAIMESVAAFFGFDGTSNDNGHLYDRYDHNDDDSEISGLTDL